MRHPKALVVALLGGGLIVSGAVLTMDAYGEKGEVSFASLASGVAKDLGVPALSRFFDPSGDEALEATGALAAEVTRGPSPAQAGVGADVEGEDPVVCIRRAGNRVCN